MPGEWSEGLARGDQLLTIEVVLSVDGEHLVASHGGRSVLYRPVTADDPVDFCA